MCAMFLEESALNSIYQLNNLLLSNLNDATAVEKNHQFRKIIIDFKQDAFTNENYFKEQMNQYILDVIKLTAIPNQVNLIHSFNSYVQQYIQHLHDDKNHLDCDDSKNGNEIVDEFVNRQIQARKIQNYYELLTKLAEIKKHNLDLEKQNEDISRICIRLEDEILYSKQDIHSIEYEEERHVEKYDRYIQGKIEDLQFLIDQMNKQLQKVPNS